MLSSLATTLYVSNLDKALGEEDLLELFKCFGLVEKLTISRDPIRK